MQNLISKEEEDMLSGEFRARISWGAAGTFHSASLEAGTEFLERLAVARRCVQCLRGILTKRNRRGESLKILTA